MKKFLRKNWLYLLGGVVVLAAFSLRFVHLTIIPVFADEAIYIRWAQVMKAEETLRFLPLSDGKEPLFMWVVIPFLKFVHNPLVAGRMTSVFSGLGTLVGVMLLSYLLFKSRKVALIAGLIYAVIPFTFFFDRLSLVDSMLAMFGIWTFILSYLAVKYIRLDFSLLAGFTLGGAWLTKSPALFFTILMPTLWLFADWKKGIKINIPKLLKIICLSAITILIGYGFYNILRLGPNFELIASRNYDYVYPIKHLFINPLDPFSPNIRSVVNWIMLMGTPGIIILWILGYLQSLKKYWPQLFVLTAWFLGPVIVQAEFAKVFTARYILFTIPYLIIISAASFKENSKKVYPFLIILLALFTGYSLFIDARLITNPEVVNLPRSERSGYLEEWTAGQGIKEAADYLIQEQYTHPSEKIIIGTEGYFGTLPDGLKIYLNNYPQITIVGVGLNFSDIPTPLMESVASGNKTYLLINSDRFKGDPLALNLKLIASFPKALRPDGTRESLLFFKLPPKQSGI